MDIWKIARNRLQNIKMENLKAQAEQKELIFQKYPCLRDWEAEIQNAFIQGLQELSGNNPEAMESAREKTAQIILKRNTFLSQQGLPVDIIVSKPLCPKCNDTGYIEQTPCGCLKKIVTAIRKEQVYKTLPLPEASFDAFDITIFSDYASETGGLSPQEAMEEIYAQCADYAQSFGHSSRNLFFNGGTGVGKTYMSCCIAKAVCDKGFDVVYVSAIDCFEALESGKFNPDYKADNSNLYSCDLLVFDDLGTEFITKTSFLQSALYHLINTRIVQKKPMIINSNLTVEDIKNRYLPQVYSRLKGDFYLISFIGDDLRQSSI